MYRKDMLDREIIRILCGTEQDDMRFHHTIQNDMQFKIYELFLTFSIFIFSDGDWLQVTETMESETQIREYYCTINFNGLSSL